ncbi:MAG: bifunctional UDP-sugar hydrolase/5'-nucleotidase [Lachnospiraceae bacterium]|nr:bifunctional UDP-sugar hydrolase/5'-nucleotidase [Lachnospiraceae bacterium]
MKKFNILKVSLIAVLMGALIVSGCGNKNSVNDNASGEVSGDSDVSEAEANAEIKILYTNDVHSYIDNVTTDEAGNITGDGLRFSKIAAMVSDMRSNGENVLLVDAGDEIQGDIYGAMDEGETIISIMRATGYQLATPGNHDFDYGVLRFLRLAETAGFPYVSSNFHSNETKEILFSDSYTFDIAGKKVAFVGVTTPETMTSSTPIYFQNEKGDFIYTIDGLVDKNDLYLSVQNAINNVKDNADYVIGIGHLGIGMDAAKKGWDSKSLIANVSGLDAFIDGHSHTTIEGETVKDKDGKDVILTQTGCYLNSIGVMTISEDGTISTELVKDYDGVDEKVAQMEQDWMNDIDDRMSEKVCVLETPLYINNPENSKERLIRSQELNLGDLSADAMYWFFNGRINLDCDIAIQNGGGIRSQLNKGDLTYRSIKQVEPFGNMVCLISAKGQQILDALEMGATVIGEWDEDWNIPAENGGFMQVAGMKYTIDSSIPSSVEMDSNGMFAKVSGEYRVKDVEVYNRDTCEYEPLDPNKTYQLAGINYLLRNSGNGLSMFDKDELTIDFVGQDYIILAEYLKSFAGDSEYPIINTKNSPLASYEGYLLDYDNPYGAGRINILK